VYDGFVVVIASLMVNIIIFEINNFIYNTSKFNHCVVGFCARAQKGKGMKNNFIIIYILSQNIYLQQIFQNIFYMRNYSNYSEEKL
jgi:hypothetical protein